MSFQYPARCAQVSTTTGTGTLTLSGSAGEKRSWGSVFGASAVVFYCIAGSGYYELGIGTFTSAGSTLSRTTVLASSNSGAKVDLVSATHDVFAWFPGDPRYVDSFSADFTLSLASACNMQMFVGSVARTVTLPALSTVPLGTRIPFANAGSAYFDFTTSDGIDNGPPYRVHPGEYGELWRDATQWRVTMSSPDIRVSVASAATVNLGAIWATYVPITGTTTITALGTARAGLTRFLEFAGALTLTHNATSLICPGGQSIVTEAGDCALAISEGSGNWRIAAYFPANGGNIGYAVLHVRRELAQNTDGDSPNTSAFTKVTLDTVKTNTIPGASVASSQITLPAGHYKIQSSVPGWEVGVMQSQLYNVTDSALIALGTTAVDNGDQSLSHTNIIAVFTLTGTKVLELRAKALSGGGKYGVAANMSTEVYQEVFIERVGR